MRGSGGRSAFDASALVDGDVLRPMGSPSRALPVAALRQQRVGSVSLLVTWAAGRSSGSNLAA
jgi:hypothetical protein